VGRGRDRGKTAVADRDIDDWRELCERDPEPLPQAVVDAVSRAVRGRDERVHRSRVVRRSRYRGGALDTVDGL